MGTVASAMGTVASAMGTVASAYKYFWHKHPGEDTIPASRYMHAINGADVRRKKLAVVGFLARMDVSTKIGRMMVETSNPDEEDAVFDAIHGLFGGEEQYKQKIKHSSWCQAIDKKKAEIYQEIETARKHVLLLRSAVSLILLLVVVTIVGLFGGGQDPAIDRIAGVDSQVQTSRPDHPPKQGGDDFSTSSEYRRTDAQTDKKPRLTNTSTIETAIQPSARLAPPPVTEELEPGKQHLVFKTITKPEKVTEPVVDKTAVKPVVKVANKVKEPIKPIEVEKAVKTVIEPVEVKKLVEVVSKPEKATQPVKL